MLLHHHVVVVSRQARWNSHVEKRPKAEGSGQEDDRRGVVLHRDTHLGKAVRPAHLLAVSVAHAGEKVGVTRVLSITVGASSHTCFHKLLVVVQVPSIMSGWTATKRPISRVSWTRLRYAMNRMPS